MRATVTFNTDFAQTEVDDPPPGLLYTTSWSPASSSSCWTRGATSPVSRRRCFNSRTHGPLTRYFAALHSGIAIEQRPVS